MNEYEIDVQELEQFKVYLDAYTSDMKSLISDLYNSIKRAADGTRDSAVAGAARDVEDTCEMLMRLIIEIEEGPSKDIGAKVRKYVNRPRQF